MPVYLAQRASLPTIDLGELTRAEPQPELVAQRASRRTRRTGHGPLTAALVLLVILGSAPSARGTRYLGDPLWTATASLAGFALGSTGIIMSEPGGVAVIGRDLATGDVRWTMTLGSRPQSISELGNGVAAVVVGATTVLMTDGGSVLARIPGHTVVPIAIERYLVVATAPPSASVGCPADGDSCTDVSTFDTAAGRPLWQLPLTGDLITSVADPDTGARRVATMRRDGMVEIHDPATGSTVRSYPMPGGRHSGHGDGGFWPPALLVGDTIVVAVRRDREAQLMAYPVGPGGYAWTASMPVSPVLTASTDQFFVAGCGRMLCLNADGANAVFAPETGDLHAQVGLEVVGQFGDFLLAVPSTERPGTTFSRPMVLVLSATDGGQVAALPDTVIVPWRDSGSRVMLTHQGPRGTDVTVLDAAGGRRLLGTVSGANLTCEAASGLLICAGPDLGGQAGTGFAGKGGQVASNSVGLVRAWRLP